MLNDCSVRPQRQAEDPRLLGISDKAVLEPTSLGHFRLSVSKTRVNRAFAGRLETLIPRGFPACLAGEASFTRAGGA